MTLRAEPEQIKLSKCGNFTVYRFVDLNAALKAHQRVSIFVTLGVSRRRARLRPNFVVADDLHAASSINISTAMVQLRGGEASMLVDGEPLNVLQYKNQVRARAERSDVSVGVCFSAGGYAGLAAGILGGVQNIVAFSPVTTVTQEAATLHPLLANFRRSIMSYSSQATGGRESIPSLLRATNYSGRILIYYPKSRPSDAYFAQQLADFPCVQINEVDTDEHAFWKHMERGTLIGRLTGIPVKNQRQPLMPR